MKKIMFLAIMAVAATSAFAQGDAIKGILKAKTYSEAESLLKSGISSMDNEQKAKAYNKLVQLSLEKVKHEEGIISSNQVAEQLKQDKREQYDTIGLYNAVYTAMKDAIECDKYDNMPNAKGKISPKFHKANQEGMWNYRVHLINAGQDASKAEKQDEALKFFGMYVESANAPLFADGANTKSSNDQYLGEVARVASVYAFQAKNLELANKYCDVALNDTAVYKDALSLKLYLMQQTLKTREDSLKCLSEFEALYAKDKGETTFSNLASMYGNLGMKDKQDKLIAEMLAANPKSFSAWAIKAQAEMNESKWDDAIADFKKAIEADSKRAVIYTYLGYCINSKAAALTTAAEQEALLKESVVYLEKARDLDPGRSEANWGYPLYQCYYTIYGAEDSRTKELENLIK